MNLDLNRITENLQQSDFVKKFIGELSETIENFNNKNEIKGEKMDGVKLTQEEEIEFEEERWNFLENYFKKELEDTSKGEIFIVTNKYENDDEYHRYKVTQYKNNIEHKCVIFEKDLPENVQLGDVVRKVEDGKYILDEKETEYVKTRLDKIKEDIVKKRN